MIVWLLGVSQETLAAAAPLHQFGTSSTNVKASDLEAERATYSSGKNSRQLELHFSEVSMRWTKSLSGARLKQTRKLSTYSFES